MNFSLDYLKVIILNGGKHNKKKPFNVVDGNENNNIKNNDKKYSRMLKVKI